MSRAAKLHGQQSFIKQTEGFASIYTKLAGEGKTS